MLKNSKLLYKENEMTCNHSASLVVRNGFRNVFGTIVE